LKRRVIDVVPALSRCLGYAEKKTMPRALVFYHYLPPDDVVSATIFGQLCEGLNERGWQVQGFSCNRSCHHPEKAYPPRSLWGSIPIERVWRPGFRQASGFGRIFNALWVIAAWAEVLWRHRSHPPELIVVGTDPILGAVLAIFSRIVLPTTKVAHWCFDLYPELAEAEGMLSSRSPLLRVLKQLMSRAYSDCDLIVDLGACMRRRLESYSTPAKRKTIVPWALAEPSSIPAPDPATRKKNFGKSKLGLLYSGTLGRAHTYESFLELARSMRETGVGFCFASRGKKADELRESLTSDDKNIFLSGFVDDSELEKRLACSDVHLVSLCDGWEGLVMPSKFFGSLAVGKPVLFAGPKTSGLAEWIEEFGVGWTLTPQTMEKVSLELQALAEKPRRLKTLQKHCWEIYQEHFSRSKMCDQWDLELRSLLSPHAASVVTPPLKIKKKA